TDRGTGSSSQVLLTFLSLLELAKMGFISVFQTDPFAEIHIEAKKAIDRDVISQVENYESVNAEAKADAIMADAQLSLEEAEGIVPDDEAGNETVVQESFADAATDDEIFAEEMKIANEDGAPALADALNEEPMHVETVVAQTEVHEIALNDMPPDHDPDTGVE